jgi:NADH-quinone oxidoreductase subunit L
MIISGLCAARPTFDSPNNHRRIAILSIMPTIIALACLRQQSMLPTVVYRHLFDFLKFGNYTCSIGLLRDSLSITVICITCFITTLVNFYSIGYMKKKVSSFLLHINSLSFITLMFSAANNLLQMYIFWLLFSFIIHFIVTANNSNTNTVAKTSLPLILQNMGDIGFMIAIAAILPVFNTLTLEDMNKYMPKNDAELMQLETIALILLVSIAAKIIQVGFAFLKEQRSDIPIPAIAMINTVGAVPAGIFLLIRLPVLFECSESIQNIIVIAGAWIAIYYGVKSVFSFKIDDLCHNSIYSQTGLMLIMCGFSSYGSAIMLFVINAFSKTLMILAFGSLVHSLSGEKNINSMGGLLDMLPKTFVSFMVVIASVIPNYYFYSVFLLEISTSELLLAYYLAFTSVIATSFMTCIYLFRNIRLIFSDGSRLSETILAYVNENNSRIIRPLYFLMFLSPFAGVIFYATCFHEVFWKDVFAFSASSSDAIIILLLYSISLIGVVCSNFKNKSTAENFCTTDNSSKLVAWIKNLWLSLWSKCETMIRQSASTMLRILYPEK